MMQNNISITTTKDIPTLKADWQRLDEHAAASISNGKIQYMDYTFYQTYAWNSFLYETYNHLFIPIEYVVVSVLGEVKLILPLLIDRLNKRLRVLTGRISGICNVVCPYKDTMAKELIQATLSYLSDKYKGGWKYKFRDVPLRSLLVEVLKDRGLKGGEKCSFHILVEQFESYDAYLSSLGKNIYKNIRKAYNHLATDGKTMSLQCYTVANQPSRRLLHDLWTLYYRRKMAWENQHKTLLRKLLIKAEAFKQAVVGRQTKSMLRLEESELFVLFIDDKIAAFMHTYVHNQHVLMPKLAIDVSFSRYSPGILLIQETMKQYIQKGIKDFDMCRGDERYKIEVGGINEPLIGFTISV